MRSNIYTSLDSKHWISTSNENVERKFECPPTVSVPGNIRYDIGCPLRQPSRTSVEGGRMHTSVTIKYPGFTKKCFWMIGTSRKHYTVFTRRDSEVSGIKEYPRELSADTLHEMQSRPNALIESTCKRCTVPYNNQTHTLAWLPLLLISTRISSSYLECIWPEECFSPFAPEVAVSWSRRIHNCWNKYRRAYVQWGDGRPSAWLDGRLNLRKSV